jgi:purine-nucleoside phosphorylase
MYEKIQETANFLKSQLIDLPTVGIILGSGLGDFVNDIQITKSIPYSEIPNFPVSTVKGHKGALVFGMIGKQQVVAMQGRFHYYEGYDMQTVTFPVRVMKFLGVQTLIVSNASGGVNPAYQVGDVVAITDHINFFPEHPLRGHNDERLGPRFLNMSEPYSKKMIKQAMEISQTLGLNIKKGIYLGLQGPTFETLAEYVMVKKVGADCVGMSTVPEVIVAKHMGLDCFGISVISDMGDEESIAEVNHHEVLMAVKKAEPKMRLLVKELILNI